MSPARADYHHGDLRAAALSAAGALLAAGGERAVTLRAVAGAVGVTHGALARPFGDRDGLLDALAGEGMAALASAVAGETGPGAGPGAGAGAGSPARFVSAYLAWALGAPALYDLTMRRVRAAPEAAARLVGAARAALGRDDEAIKAMWMTLHGGLALRAAGALAERDEAAFRALMVRLTGTEG